jgi:hypothetical protein
LPGRQRRPAPLIRVAGRALRLGEAVEPGLDQDSLQPIVKSTPGRARQLGPADHQVRLPFALSAQRHSRPRSVMAEANQPDPISSTGC